MNYQAQYQAQLEEIFAQQKVLKDKIKDESFEVRNAFYRGEEWNALVNKIFAIHDAYFAELEAQEQAEKKAQLLQKLASRKSTSNLYEDIEDNAVKMMTDAGFVFTGKIGNGTWLCFDKGNTKATVKLQTRGSGKGLCRIYGGSNNCSALSKVAVSKLLKGD